MPPPIKDTSSTLDPEYTERIKRAFANFFISASPNHLNIIRVRRTYHLKYLPYSTEVMTTRRIPFMLLPEAEVKACRRALRSKPNHYICKVILEDQGNKEHVILFKKKELIHIHFLCRQLVWPNGGVTLTPLVCPP